MYIENSIFYKDEWRWSIFIKHLISQLNNYDCIQSNIPSKFSYKESTYGSKRDQKKVSLLTWAVHNQRINFARAVCINSPNYSVLNFLIIPQTIYNVPFFGLDFVSLPNKHLIVLDFQPSLKIENQFSKKLLDKIIKIKSSCHSSLPIAEEMPNEVKKFFSPGLIWSKLPKEQSSDILIENQLYISYKEYLNLYLNILSDSKEVNKKLQQKIINGQNLYLEYRKNKDPARPMLSNLFGKSFTELLINKVLFTPSFHL